MASRWWWPATIATQRYSATETGAYFVSPSTIAPALIAYGAKIRIYSAKAGGSGVRELPLGRFFITPKSANEREHDLKPDEMVIELMVPPAPQNLKTGYFEVRQKAAFDWPLAMAAVALQMDGNTVKSARVVHGTRRAGAVGLRRSRRERSSARPSRPTPRWPRRMRRSPMPSRSA